MIRIVLEGLLLGLSTGAYCLGTCMVFFMPYLLVEGKPSVRENSGKIILFLSGRLIAYLSFALLAGWIGKAYPNLFNAKVANISLIIVSLLMLLYALGHSFPGTKTCQPRLEKFNFTRLPFFLGLFTGLNPCFPFLAGLSRLLTLKSILAGVILFSAFFLGTSIYMIPLIFVSYLNRMERVRQIGVMVALLSSIWFLFVGIAGVMR